MSMLSGNGGWPLSGVQSGIWHAQQLHPGSPGYQIGVYLAVDGPARPDLLEAAVRRAVAETETLRLRVVLVDGVPRQVPTEDSGWPVEQVNLAGAASPETAAQSWMRAALDRPSEPAGRLFGIALLRLSPSRVWLFVRADHLVMDGYSINLLARRVVRLYAAGLTGAAPERSRWGSSRLLFEEEAAYRDSDDLDADRRYWRDRLAGRTGTPGLAGRRGRAPGRTLRDEYRVDGGFPDRLRSYAERLGIGWPALVVAGCAGYLHRATGRRDLVVGFPVLGRSTRAALTTPGMTANVVPLRLATRPESSLAELARAAYAEMVAARRHQRYPYDELLRDLQLDGGLCDISVNVLPFGARLRAGDHRVTLHVLANGPTDDLYVGYLSDPDGRNPLLCLEGHPEVYDRPDLARHRTGILGVLTSWLADPELPIGAVDVLTADDRRTLLATSTASLTTSTAGLVTSTASLVTSSASLASPAEDRAAPVGGTVAADGAGNGWATLPEGIAAQAARTPHAVAVLAGDREVDHAELETRVRRLARVLVEQGVRPESPVVVAMERSVELLVSLLAVWRAGGFFVPVDAQVPAARLRLILRQSGAVLLLADRRPVGTDLPVLLPAEVLATTPEPGAGTEQPGETGRAVVDPARAAYAMYTSGSTGAPKGVLVSHGAIANRIRWTVRRHRLGPADRILAKTALSFDAVLWELFAPLVSGAVVVLAPPGAEHDPRALVAAVSAHDITVVQGVPSVLRMLVDIPGWADCRSLRLLFSAGEPLHAGLAHRLVAPNGAELWNMYGPTECAIDVTAYPFATAQRTGPVPIGLPIDGTRVLVLGESGELVPPGVAGELYAGGVGLARGYLGNPGLTAERFVPDPYGPAGARLYRTGDLVRRRADGLVEYLGRRDDQVKVNGVRVEPGEIEAVLAEHPAVSGAVVLVVEDGRSRQRPDDSGGGSDIGGGGSDLSGGGSDLGGGGSDLSGGGSDLGGGHDRSGSRDGSGTRRLAAYVTARGELTGPVLRAWLAERLPRPMVPSSCTVVDKFPLTSSGKVDRAALRGTAAGGPPYVAPRTPQERLVVRVWSRLLDLDRVGVHDDFFQLGGTSLLVTQLAEALRVETGRPVPFRRLFDASTVADQARLVTVPSDGGRPTANDAPSQVDSPAPPEGRSELPVPIGLIGPIGAGPAELSVGQYRLWLLDRMDPGSPEWVVPILLTLPRQVDAAVELRQVRTALRGLADRHDVLRTRYPVVAGEPRQVVEPAAGEVEVAVAHRAEDDVPDACAELLRRGFDLATGPVWRALLIRVPDGPSRLVLSVHHIACDGWSTVLLERDFQHLYRQAAGPDGPSGGTGTALPVPPIRYADFAAWQRRVLTGAALDDQLAFWRRTLASVPVLELPTDQPRPAQRDPAGALATFTVPAGPAQRLLRLGRAHGATPFMTLLAGFAAMLSRYTGQSDLAIGTPLAGRPGPQVRDVVGFFVNSVVLRCDLGGEPTFRDLLDRTRQVCQVAFAHQDVPFERLVDELGVRRDPSRTPLVQVGFDLDEEGVTSTGLAGSDAETLGRAWRIAKTDLTLRIRRLGDGSLLGGLEYATALFAPDTVHRMAAYLRHLLVGVADRPDQAVADLAPTDPPATDPPATDPPATDPPATDPPATDPPVLDVAVVGVAANGGPPLVPDALTAQARRAPHATAVVAGRRTVSFAELDARAERLAGALRQRGVGPETVVGVLLDREPDLVASLLAVWRAGAAYLPLDPGTPVERVGELLDDARAVALLTSSAQRDRIDGDRLLPCVLVDRETGPPADPAPARPVDPDQLAYVVYTSGSTGRPKGVQVSHRSLAHHLDWAVRSLAARGTGGAPLFSSVGYDLVVTTLYAPLLAGQTLHLLPPALPVTELGRALAEAGPFSFVKLTPGHLELLGYQLDDATAARIAEVLVVAGDALPAPLARRWLRLLGPGRLVNSYGPTEATVNATVHLVGATPEAGVVPIGRPRPGVRAYLLDGALRPLPRGAVGELFLGGAGVARGYLGRPALTAERFLPDPYGPPGARMYRTGDLARMTVHGDLAFHGRTDQQVKIRGHRVEPGEIRGVLLGHPGVRDAVVGVDGDRLVGYLVPAGDGGPDGAELVAYCRRRLPEHMVPAYWVRLAAVPLTPNGKVDRAALPAPVAEPADTVGPRDAVEERLVDLWAELFGGRVGVHDDFFRLGGNSLLAMRMLAGVQREFEVQLPAAAFFAGPTVAELAAELVRAISAEVADLTDAEVADALSATGTPPLATEREPV
ncbi:amino acid adenylation domain-containing protein [Plantactinospora sp. CA-294935]|uniref:amino acid adenylation domain-containing protein n=1 Tax=Plantactinospora sp. CA-294935 TaxID=3240012 RepID=UPI003D94B664